MKHLKYFKVNTQEWNYEENGPDIWFTETGNEKCAGSMQSPINIQSDTLQYGYDLAPFIFNNFNLC